jgi:hypothetical protein
MELVALRRPLSVFETKDGKWPELHEAGGSFQYGSS